MSSGKPGNVPSVPEFRPLNRIQQASSSGPAWGEAYSLDYWGNLTNRTLVSGKNNSEPFPANATVNTSNQLTSTNIGYDAAGNMTSNSGYTYFYDAENRITNTAGYTYVYDGDGNRVEKCVGNSCSGSASGQLYWFGTGGAASAETDLTGNLLHHYIFFNGQRIARFDSSDSTNHYYFSDELGTHDVVTTSTGVCEQDIDFYPYGGTENDYCPARAQNYKFTGKERDVETGNDMFGARYYASSMSRFMTPDWAGTPTTVPYANFGNPQSLNLYSYVENNPTTFGDPDGHEGDGPGLVTEIEEGVDLMSQEANAVANEIGAGMAGSRLGPVIAVGAALGVEAYALIDADATQTKADADMKM